MPWSLLRSAPFWELHPIGGCGCVCVCVCVWRGALGFPKSGLRLARGRVATGAAWHPHWRKATAAGELWRGLLHHPSGGACALLRTLVIVGYSSHLCLSGRTCIKFTYRRDTPHIGDSMPKSGSHFKKLYLRIKTCCKKECIAEL